MSNNDEYRQKDIRKSRFVETSASQGTDFFDLVRNGQNLKISQQNLVNDFGVTGSLETQGEISGTPVLDKDGAVNYIRNILGNSGIVASVSPQDGVQLDHNFEADKGGTPVLINESSVQPTIRSLVAGSGINIGASGGEIQIAVSETPVSTKTVIVSNEDDFPTPVGGVITLEDDTEYRLINDVSTANRFISGAGTVIQASNERLITLEYTGTGIMLTASDVTFTISDIKMKCQSATLVDVASTTGAHSAIFTNVLIDCDVLGTFDQLQLIYFRAASIVCATDGMSFANSCITFYWNTSDITISATGAKAIDLNTATFIAITIQSVLFNLADATSYCISGLADSGNLATGGYGTVIITQQIGSGTFLENISPYDDDWEFALNANAQNSTNLALATHAGTTVTITTANTPVIIGPTWVAVDMHRFTHAVGGRWTYTGKGAHVATDVSISGQRSASGTDTYGFYFYLNGVQVAETLVTRTFTNSTGNVSMIWDFFLETDDYLEVWVENQTGTTDFQVDDIKLRFV